MARKPAVDVATWPALSLEGNLLSPAMIAAVERREASQQDEASYGVRKGLTIRDEISTAFRVAQAHYDGFARQTAPSAAATARYVQDLLREAFGFADLARAAAPLALSAGTGRVPIVVVPPGDALDRRSAALSTERSRSAVLVLQDALNGSDACLWGLATNGSAIRLMRDNASLTRPAYIEADLARIFEAEDMASFAILWLLIHRSRFGEPGQPATDCVLERWREEGGRAGETARDRLAAQVEQALRDLGSGFLEANPELRRRLLAGEVDLTAWFNELLRLVYRLIFLMVAEDRDLLHAPGADGAARRLYAEGFGLAMLRTHAVRRGAWDRHHDRWEGMKIVFKALARGEKRLGLPALGGLFSPSQLATLESASLSNRALLSALYRLGWLGDRGAIVPVNWQAMETEELGSVYESLLELQPQLADDGRELRFASDASETRGNQRKSTGSYYTPDSLVQALLDSALDPVLDRAESGAADPAESLLSLSVIDPACGSGHFLLAAARRIATRVARHRAQGMPSAIDFRHALRDVARRCLYGVDRNPMAVELAKVALWIETVDPGLPLGFFDAQIRCGDALLGVFDLAALDKGIPDAAYKPLSGDDKLLAKHYAAKNRREKAEREKVQTGFDFGRRGDLARAFAEFRTLPETTVEEVAAKSARLAALTADGAVAWTLGRSCDLYVAAFLLPKIADARFAGPDGLPRRGAETVPTSGAVWELLRGAQPFGPMMAAAAEASGRVRAFHWPLEFPDLIARGGFDAVLGNPPWEVMQLSEKEYFAARHPEIAVLAGSHRKKAIARLETTNGHAYAAYLGARRGFDAGNEFAREAGRFDLTAKGKINTYGLFAELFSSLTGANGRAGVIVPTGIATDASTAPFFAALVENKRLASVVDFENRAGLFPAVDSRMKFCLLTLGHDVDEARFAFFLTGPAQLAEPERNFTLSPEQIARFNPNTRTAPVFRSKADAELTAKIYANAPILVDECKGATGNPWGVEFRQGLFNMTSDSGVFRTAAQLQTAGFRRQGTDWSKGKDRYVPLYEAKMVHQFDHRWAAYGADGEESADVSLADKQNPAFEPSPRYWVLEAEVDTRLAAKGWTRGWLMGWRDIARATDERTVISVVFPRVGAGDTLLIMLPSVSDHRLFAAALANLCSMTLDYAARQKIGGTHLKYNTFKQLPVLPPEFYAEPRLSFVSPRVLELTFTSKSLSSFARDLGHDGPAASWESERRAHLRAELDAFYARAYGLTRNDLRYILDPADVKGAGYPSETFRVLKGKEIRQYGEYRTARLVLAAWDRMEADGSFKKMDL